MLYSNLASNFANMTNDFELFPVLGVRDLSRRPPPGAEAGTGVQARRSGPRKPEGNPLMLI